MRKLSVANIDERLYPVLEKVTDPEVPVLTILDLGIVRYAGFSDDGLITIKITPTYSGCPAMDVIQFEINAVLETAGFHNVTIETILSPAWTTDWMTDEGKEKLKNYGIAPPSEKTSDVSFITGSSKVINCPHCGSSNTEMISLFGSTACKSLYKCNDCQEPFDYFKCH
jgi:ring-1,2-phenylacetyl-CoA epoxidase subunit PaaD